MSLIFYLIFLLTPPQCSVFVHGVAVTSSSCALALTANPITLPTAPVGKTTIYDLVKLGAVSGGKAPYTFTLTGKPPKWVTLSPAGVLTVTPPLATATSLTWDITDSQGVNVYVQ